MYFIRYIIYIKNESCNSYLRNKEQKQCFYLFHDRTRWLCALFLRGRSGARVKLRSRKMKLNLSWTAACMLHYIRNIASNFLVFHGGHIQTKQKRFTPITLLKGALLGYFSPFLRIATFLCSSIS